MVRFLPWGPRKLAICFVDDEVAEVDRLKKSLGDRFLVGGGTSIDSALAELRAQGARKPDLFLVDLYSAHGPIASPSQIRELTDARATFLKAESEFDARLAAVGLTVDDGFRNARAVRSRYRLLRVPVAFFTRKGTLADAIRARDEGLPVIRKPDPSAAEIMSVPNEEVSRLYDEALEQRKETVAAEVERVIRESSWWFRYGDFVLVTIGLAFLVSLASNLLAAWILARGVLMVAPSGTTAQTAADASQSGILAVTVVLALATVALAVATFLLARQTGRMARDTHEESVATRELAETSKGELFVLQEQTKALVDSAAASTAQLEELRRSAAAHESDLRTALQQELRTNVEISRAAERRQFARVEVAAWHASAALHFRQETNRDELRKAYVLAASYDFTLGQLPDPSRTGNAEVGNDLQKIARQLRPLFEGALDVFESQEIQR